MRRSMLEMDLYFSRFIDSGGLEQLDASELKEYQELLEYDDGMLLQLMHDSQIVNSPVMQGVLAKISLASK